MFVYEVTVPPNDATLSCAKTAHLTQMLESVYRAPQGVTPDKGSPTRTTP